jgi:hypothetical protein
MALNEITSCITTIKGDLKFDDSKFPIVEIELDGEEMPATDECIKSMICTLDF